MMKKTNLCECPKCHRMIPMDTRCPWCEPDIEYYGYDMLEGMLALQKGFQEKYKNRFRFTKLLDSIAIIMEAAELIDATNVNKKGNNYKWWSQKTHTREERLVELIDLWHFMMLYMLMEKISPREFYEAYIKKLGINYERQESDKY
jgi:hypothetical protein